MEETKLVQKAKSGDREAFGELVSLYKDSLYRFCYGMLRAKRRSRKEDAEDATRKAFLRAFENIARLRSTGSFKTCLYSIAFNICIDEIKRAERFPELSDDVDLDSVLDDRETAEEMLLGTERKRLREKRLEEEVGSLPDEQRALILLVHVEGFSYKEAAEKLNIPLGTVRSSLSRGTEPVNEMRHSPLEDYCTKSSIT